MMNQIFYTGIVEDRNDPSKLGRVRVRVHGAHTFDRALLPTENLPWAFPIQSINSAATSGIGISPTGMVEGSVVVIFFIDGKDQQQPMIMGTLAGIPNARGNAQYGFQDPNGVYPLDDFIGESDSPRRSKNEKVEPETSEKNIFSGAKDTYNEPDSSYGAEYPKNHAYFSESGHLQEFDDTPGKERINTQHRTGSKTEYQPDGSLIKKIIKDNYEIIYGDDKVFVKGNCSITVEGNVQLLVKKSAEIVVDGNMNLKVKGNYCTSVDGAYTLAVKGDSYIHSDNELLLSGIAIHENTEGKNPPDGLCPSLDITALDAALQDDEPETDSGINQDTYEQLKDRSGDTSTGTESTPDITLPPSTPKAENIQVDTSQIPDPWSYDTKLSSRFTVASLSTKTAFPHPIKAQLGLSERQIITNLKALVENIIEPIGNKYGYSKMQINSGFRVGSGSQHNKGEAVDLQFRGWTANDYRNAVAWIRDTLHFDQVILEKGYNYWIHCSYSSRHRKQVLTRTSPGVYKPGIILVT
jgi:hypothetical protein